MNQRVVGPRFPYLSLRVSSVPSRNPVEIEAEAFVDTGFDGDLIIPAALIPDSPLPDGYLTWRLGDGSDVVAAYYVGTVEIVGLPGSFPAVVSILGDEAIVGRSLTDRFTVIFDHGQRIIVEP